MAGSTWGFSVRRRRALRAIGALAVLPACLAAALAADGGASPAGERAMSPRAAEPQDAKAEVQDAEAEVRAALEAAVAAWSAGDFAAFASQYDEGVRGFFLDGAPLTRGFDAAALRMAHDAGLTATVSIREADVRVLGATAVTVAYLEGTINLPGGAGAVGGTWRYSDTRVRRDDGWKIVQYHLSDLAGGR